MKKIVLGIGMAAVICFTVQSGEYWITPTGVDGTGDGSVANPWVRTTAASFDALMNGSTIPNGSTVHLREGPFVTRGIIVRPGLKIRGAGMGATVVKVDNDVAAANNAYTLAFDSGFAVLAHGAEISDMTIDCNLQGQTVSSGGTAGAVKISGSNTRLSRLKFINWGTSSYQRECFVAGLGYDFRLHTSPGQGGQMVSNCVIEACVLTQPANIATNQEGTTGLYIIGHPYDLAANPGCTYPCNGPTFGQPGPGWVNGCEIKDCLIMGIVSGSGPGKVGYFNGIQMGYGTINGRVHGNIAIDIAGPSARVVYNENSYFSNLAIEGNWFYNVSAAFMEDSGGNTPEYLRRNLLIRNNSIWLRNDEPLQRGISFYVSSSSALLQGAIISDNVILSAEGSPSSSITERTGIYSQGTTVANLSVKNNLIDVAVGAGRDLIFFGNNLVESSSNTKLNGEPIRTDLPLEGRTEIKFIPTQAGWYRILGAANYSAGKVNVTLPNYVLNTVSSFDFDYAMSFGAGPGAGVINVTRNGNYGSGTVTKIRISSDPWVVTSVNPPDGYLPLFLDVFIAGTDSFTPITLSFSERNIGSLTPSAPQFLHATTPPTAQYQQIIDVGIGLRTTGPVYAGHPQKKIADENGNLLSSALSGTVAPANGGLGVDASTFPADRIPYTSSAGAFGQATLTAYGRDLIDSPDYLAARSSLQLVPGTHVQPYSSRLADISALFPDSGSILVGNGTTWAKLGFDSTLGKVLVSNGSTVQWGNALWETSESSSTPVTDTASTAVGSTSLRLFDFVTLPTTEKLYVITGIEWKNGTTVAGNTVCGAVLANANPPTVAAVPTIAYGLLTANSGASSIQRVSQIVSQPIRGGTILGVFIQADNSTHTYRTATVASANNRKSTVTFPANGNVANQENAAWVANTTKAYIKVYYRGYR